MQHLFLLILMAGKEPNLAWADAARSLACVVVLTLSTALQGWVGDGLQLNMAFWGLMSLQAASACNTRLLQAQPQRVPKTILTVLLLYKKAFWLPRQHLPAFTAHWPHLCTTPRRWSSRNAHASCLQQ